MERSIENYVHSEAAHEKLYKRSLIIVVLSQIFGGAGLAAGITVGALIAQDMLGTESYAGLPAALFTLGSALSAYLVGRLSQKHGRRKGLSTGFFVGGIGAIGVIFATTMGNVIFLFIALFVYGAGTSTNLQARYAGTDLAKENQRATAASIAMVSTTFGAVAGPNLVTPMGKVAEAIGIPALAGPFILAAAAYLLAGLVLFLFLRPDPLKVAEFIALQESKQETETATGEKIGQQTVNKSAVLAGAGILVISHVVMVAVMTMTPVQMKNHGASLSAVGFVIGLHIAAMYLPSIGTGVLVDKIGRKFMATASVVTLAFSGLLAAFAPGDSLFLLTTALVLLGVGWNFGLISGTAIIVDATTIDVRARTQGSVDVWVAIGGTFGSLVSGIVVAALSYMALGIIGAGMALVMLIFILGKGLKDVR
ncbi:MAG TPA: MFS transporter [Pseudogracilibacillus sp.]|nr:MFS transporter [Pseudogracilibacillus sp.]